ncbi:MAG: hypothetical protein R3D62_07235 [Xanthobacteraceae bacterium]
MDEKSHILVLLLKQKRGFCAMPNLSDSIVYAARQAIARQYIPASTASAAAAVSQTEIGTRRQRGISAQ